MRVGDAIVRLRACETTAPWEVQALTGAFVQLDVRNPQGRWQRVFSGWLYKETPSLNVVEHPIYDVWPKSCAMTHPEAGESTVRATSAASSRSSAPNSAPTPRARRARRPPGSGARAVRSRRRQRGIQQRQIILLGHLDRAEAAQMVGHELAVEQPVAADPQPRHQPGERHLGRVAPGREHALAEEGGAEADSVEAAGELALVPAFDRMGVAAGVEEAVALLDVAR